MNPQHGLAEDVHHPATEVIAFVVGDDGQLCSVQEEPAAGTPKDDIRTPEDELYNLEENNSRGASTCNICGKSYKYFRSFLKHAEEHSTTVLGGNPIMSRRARNRRLSHNEKPVLQNSQVYHPVEKTENHGTRGKVNSVLMSSSFKSGRLYRRKPHVKVEASIEETQSPNTTAEKMIVQKLPSPGIPGLTCQQCGARFSRKSGLRDHIHFVHERYRPYPCDFCCSKFCRPSQLMNHLDRRHKDTDSFIIPVAPASHVPKEIKLENEEEPADEALLSISSVTSSPPRKRMHLEIKPEPHTILCVSAVKESTQKKIKLEEEEPVSLLYACKIPSCGKIYRSRHTYLKHKKDHRIAAKNNTQRLLQAIQGSLSCPVCGAHFSRRGHLYDHILYVHEKYRPHGCDMCDQQYTRPSELQRHIEKCHAGGVGNQRTKEAEKVEQGSSEVENQRKKAAGRKEQRKKKKIQIVLPRKQSNPTAPSSEIRNENSVSLMKPSAVLQRNSMLIACFDEISNENSEHMLSSIEDYDGYSEQLLYSSDACNASSVHTPGNNDILNGSSVHTPGNNDILNGSSVHTPGNNDILNGSSVHTPGNNDILNGSSVHTPCSNDTVIENSTYMNQHSQLDDSDGLSMIQISNVTSLVMSQADFLQTPGTDEVIEVGSVASPVCSARSQQTKPHARKYICGVCGQEHRLYSSLLKHKWVHSGRRRVFCLLCGRSFLQPKDLDRHIACVHSQSFRFKCTHCEMGFSRRVLFCKHVLLAHCDLESLKCHICKKKYKTAHHLQGHIQKHHSVCKQL
ncbi:zinc finger protein Xfin-like isoform X1 [Acipenser ruthenus]|uniref:zinc finger protein Xfin-like isoform X1 n=1 Tax=Acipenser ruthenus TaxID=7906 RepID=UPI00145BD366|nr:zinc finger protein Xfin-like isoform X1 [Acipenser ruthenus]